MVEANGKSPVVEIKDAVKTFRLGGQEIAILKGVSLQVNRGESLAVIGPSGHGKSTLLNLIAGIDRPSSGEVVVDGQRIDQMAEDRLAAWRGEHVGIVFQFFQLLPALSVLQNVILPMDLARKFKPRDRRERAMHLLEIVGLQGEVRKLPGELSGGQQQRAAIARALANDPALLVADEPTGNLDSHASGDVLDALAAVAAQGKTLLIATHDKEVARRTRRQVEIWDGLITRDACIDQPS